MKQILYLLFALIIAAEGMYWGTHFQQVQAIVRTTYDWGQRHLGPVIDRVLPPQRDGSPLSVAESERLTKQRLKELENVSR